MIDNQILINNYRPFLGYYEALKLETVSKYFRYSPRKRYFSSYCLITKLCRVSAIIFSESYYHDMYHLLTSLSLLVESQLDTDLTPSFKGNALSNCRIN